MGRSVKVTGIATQGRQDADQWVTAYYVYISSDGVNFAKVKHWWNYVKVEYLPWHRRPLKLCYNYKGFMVIHMTLRSYYVGLK